MAATKRTKFETVRDQAIISELYLEGKTQHDIAAELNSDPKRTYTLSQQMISRDLKVIQNGWIEKSMMDFNRARAEQLAKIDKLEYEYWKAWERSKKQKKKTESKQDVGGAEDKQKSRQSAKITTEDSTGNMKYLDGVQWCIDRRCQLLGLDAPRRLKVEDNRINEIPWDRLTKDELTRISNGEEIDKIIPSFKRN